MNQNDMTTEDILPTNELIRILRDQIKGRPLTDRDAALMCAAADRLEELDERIAIMEEGCALSGPSGQLPQRGSQITIAPGANVDLTAILDSIEKATSGLIEEE